MNVYYISVPDEKDLSKKKYDETLRKIFNHVIKFNTTKVEMESIFKIVDFADTRFSYPTTNYNILKSLDQGLEMTFYSKCDKCKNYKKVENNDHKEVNCVPPCKITSKFNEANCFVYFDLNTQIKDDISKNWTDIYSFYREAHRNQISDTSGNIRDVYSSRIFKDAYANVLNSVFLLPFCVNTDGVQVFKSTAGAGLWPIFLMKHYVKPEKRYGQDNMLLAALYYGDGKPNMNEFLAPLINQFKEYKLKRLRIAVNNRHIQFEPRILTFCADLPAKAAVQQFVQYNMGDLRADFVCILVNLYRFVRENRSGMGLFKENLLFEHMRTQRK